MLKGNMLKTFSLKVKRQKCLLLPFFQHCTGWLTSALRQVREIKIIRIGKEKKPVTIQKDSDGVQKYLQINY